MVDLKETFPKVIKEITRQIDNLYRTHHGETVRTVQSFYEQIENRIFIKER
jgi:hypothetical protein